MGWYGVWGYGGDGDHSSGRAAMARSVNLLLVGSRCMKRWMTRQAMKASRSGAHSPWLTGSFLRPSSSQRKPSFSTNAMKCVSTLLRTRVDPFFTDSRCFCSRSLLSLKPSPTSAGVFPKDSSANLARKEPSLTRSGQSQMLLSSTWKSAMVPQAFLAYCRMKKTLSVTRFFSSTPSSAFSKSRCSWLISQRKTSPSTGCPSISCAHSSTDSRSCTAYASAFIPNSRRKPVITSGLDYIGSQLSSSLLSILYKPEREEEEKEKKEEKEEKKEREEREEGEGKASGLSVADNNFRMEQSMQHYQEYGTDSQLQWPGLTSNRFPRPRLMHPHRDSIKTGMDLPADLPAGGRKHFEPQRSGEFVFRPRLKQVGEMEHWHLRPSNKRILDLQFSQPHARRERSHFPAAYPPSPSAEAEFAGIRTFFNSRLRDGIAEYSLEDRMQRKVRIDQLSLRKNAFRNESLCMSMPLKAHHTHHPHHKP